MPFPDAALLRQELKLLIEARWDPALALDMPVYAAHLGGICHRAADAARDWDWARFARQDSDPIGADAWSRHQVWVEASAPMHVFGTRTQRWAGLPLETVQTAVLETVTLEEAEWDITRQALTTFGDLMPSFVRGQVETGETLSMLHLMDLLTALESRDQILFLRLRRVIEDIVARARAALPKALRALLDQEGEQHPGSTEQALGLPLSEVVIHRQELYDLASAWLPRSGSLHALQELAQGLREWNMRQSVKVYVADTSVAGPFLPWFSREAAIERCERLLKPVMRAGPLL